MKLSNKSTERPLVFRIALIFTITVLLGSNIMASDSQEYASVEGIWSAIVRFFTPEPISGPSAGVESDSLGTESDTTYHQDPSDPPPPPHTP
jgi:hypothetical protein